ncbi:hypothetical protein LSG31_13605 [Fodinisporobacter ferrooxydans]|uniref:Uncharacterized protein n=1 Tax=Fodinisporobacter ferrooxydans TaxID=2901836 RepID=A0ABY4CEK1_9BACL|nr:hypothetical protein LSG31_13605 [Alicyclobacillaceae bacterium MYW30-H2]
MKLDDVMQVLENKRRDLYQKKTSLENELKEVQKTLEGVQYLVQVTAKLNNGEALGSNFMSSTFNILE